jgi:hypothetical protein
MNSFWSAVILALIYVFEQEKRLEMLKGTILCSDATSCTTRTVRARRAADSAACIVLTNGRNRSLKLPRPTTVCFVNFRFHKSPLGF